MRALWWVVLVACGGKADECADVKQKLRPLFEARPGVEQRVEAFCTGDDPGLRECVRRAFTDDAIAECVAVYLDDAPRMRMDKLQREPRK